MKSFLIIALFAIVACGSFEDRLIEVFTCLVKNEKIKDSVVSVVKAVKTKDLQTIFSAVVSSYFTVKDDVKKCLEFEPTLSCDPKINGCLLDCPRKNLERCKKDCLAKYC